MTNEQLSALVAEAEELAATEQKARLQYAEALAEVTEAAAALTGLITQRNSLAQRLCELGINAEGTTTEISPFLRLNLGAPSLVQNARDWLEKVKAGTWNTPAPIYAPVTVQQGWQADGLPEPVRHRPFQGKL